MLRINYKKIEKGDTFLDLYKSEENILNAISNGAVCVICESGEYDVKTINVKDPSKYLSDYLKEVYGYKIKHMKLIAITGSLGKSSVCFFTYQIFNKMGIKCAYIGKRNLYFEERCEPIDNLNLYTIYEILSSVASAEIVIIEASKELLKENGLKGLSFDLVGVTNLDKKETNIEKEMELFTQTKGKKYALINYDDKFYESFILENNKNILFGTKKCDYYLKKLNFTFNDTSLNILSNGLLYNLKIPFVSKANAFNFLMAYAITNLFGIKESDIVGCLPELKTPKGVLESYNYKDSLIIVDGAQSLFEIEGILKNTREYCLSKIITVIGSDSLKDKNERAKIGNLVLKKSDEVIFTNDNPREEDEKEIINDMINGVEGNYNIIYNRKDAISEGVNKLEKGDILLILGRGDSEYQKIGLENIYLKDSEVVLKCIK